MTNAASLSVAIIAVVALTVCGRLLAAGRGRNALPGCGPESGCDAVLSSRWARWAGLPVALPATTNYLLMLVASAALLLGRGRDGWAIDAVVLAALIAGGSALWFVFLQAAVVRRFCAYCMMLHVAGLSACAIVVVALPLQVWFNNATLTVVGCAMATLICGQLLFAPRRYAILDVPSPTQGAAPLPTPTAPLPAASAAVARPIAVLRGRLTLDGGEWPRLGSADAPHVVVYLFDYTCLTCRNVHRLLTRAIESCGLDVAVLMVPAPVDPTCNPHVRRQSATHAHSCRFARLGLMVWRADPAKFAAYDHWAFADAEPPTIGLARAHAEELLGLSDLDPSVPDGDLEKLIAKGVAAYRTAESGKMPTLLFPDAALSGEVPSVERLVQILLEQFTPRG